MPRLGRPLLFLVMVAACPPFAVAETSKKKSEIPQIPKTPTAPPSMVQAIPTDPFHCHRRFIHEGKTLDCDNDVQKDGEKLRPILKEVPAALSELDEYQQTQRRLSKTAYIVSGAFVLALGGYIATRATGAVHFRTASGEINPPYLITIGGMLASAGAFTYGFVLYQRNETRLTAAVNAYNNARPNSPIELEFSTGIHF